MRRGLLLAAIGVAALALSIPLALLGRAVLATPGTTSPSGVPERAAAELLAAERAQRFSTVVDAYREAVAVPALAIRANNPIQLAHLIPTLPSAKERSQAHVMVGAIFALPAGDGRISFDLLRRAGAMRFFEQATAEFHAGARADDGNEAAKYDLELVLKQLLLWQRQQQSSSDGDAKNGKQRTRRNRQNPRSIDVELQHAGIYSTGTGY